MNPNAALTNARAAVLDLQILGDKDIAPGDDVDHDAAYAHAAGRLTEAFLALDGWFAIGGFRPEAWMAVAHDHWDDHRDYPVADWQDAVTAGVTRLGYADWRRQELQND